MFKALISFALGISSICAFSIANPRDEFTCQECVRELRDWGKLVITSNDDIGAYLQTHWCPSVVPNDDTCVNDIALAYPMMADSIVVHFFIDGAIEMCTAEGICQAKDLPDLLHLPAQREYTCQECVQGLEFIAALLGDPLFVDQMVLRLKTHYCFLQENEAQCQRDVEAYFPSLHRMAINHFMIPVDICTENLGVCGGTEPPPF